MHNLVKNCSSVSKVVLIGLCNAIIYGGLGYIGCYIFLALPGPAVAFFLTLYVMTRLSPPSNAEAIKQKIHALTQFTGLVISIALLAYWITGEYS